MQTKNQEEGHEKKPRIFGIRRATGMAIRKLPRATAVTKTAKSSGNFWPRGNMSWIVGT
jgi:hypothetical protein